MTCGCEKKGIFVLFSLVFMFLQSNAIAQEAPPDFLHRPANLSVIQEYLTKLGYSKAKPFKDSNLEGVAFVVKDHQTDEIIKFSTLINPNDRILKFECHDLATVPPNPDRLIMLVQKLVELNGTRTIGKYYVNFDSGKIQFFYFQSVVGGVCFADFERTVKLIEFIVFKDLKTIRELVAS
jgi:hypothetical protein